MLAKSTLITIASVAGIIILCAVLFRFCQKPSPKVVAHKENLEKIKENRIEDEKEAEVYRKRYDSLIASYQDRVDKIEYRYIQVKAKDQKAEIIYRQAPTLQKCDSALAAKNERIKTMEEKDAENVRIIQTERLRVQNADTLTARQKRTILALEKGYEGAVKDLKKATRKKRFVVSAGVTTGFDRDLQHQSVAGIHLGYKLIQF